MKHFSRKFIGVALLVAFGVFFGIDIATEGIETIHGPMGTSAAPGLAEPADREPTKPVLTQGTEGEHQESEKAEAGASANANAPAAKTSVNADPASGNSESGINRLANKIGGLLQIIAHHGIESAVSLFEKLLP